MAQPIIRDWEQIELVPLAGGSRDNAWLQELLDITWDRWFRDIVQSNDVRIEFGRRARRRLGSISLDPTDRQTSIITMNGYFKDPGIPEFVILATLVHELTHYAHGFNSPLAQSKAYPHAGGVIRREYGERGLLTLYIQQKNWLKRYWVEYLAKHSSDRSVAPKSVSRFNWISLR